ncbi:hypothetical protein Pcinc_015931 [Petrolisthes cinctipes]|uniref:Chondroitin proteoglycan 4 domain-containing protein n=1 Tax=Petrolisthes cinctipes TaxID=88211 RepID=A0AAE1KQ67_PETCI|nr:hypothetical protein Pcinc_015931 [Petrolisthes cinctipes]
MLLMMSTTAVEANKPQQFFNLGDGEGEDGSSSGLFRIIRRILSRRQGGGGNGDGDGERGGFFNGILQLLNNLFNDGDDGDVETTTGGASERLRMMTRGRNRIHGFLHTFFGTVANYGFAFTCGGSPECVQCVMDVPGANITSTQEFKECVRTILTCTEQCYDVMKECARSIPLITDCFSAEGVNAIP